MSKAIDNAEALAYVTRDEQGGYHVVDADGNVGPVCRRFEENLKTIVLTKNASGRSYVAVKVVDAYMDAEGSDGKYPLYPREAQHFGEGLNYRIPNASLIKYLSEEDQKEYNAIIQRAIDAKNADKKRPLTQEEKLRKQIADAQAKLTKLLAQANGETIEEA